MDFSTLPGYNTPLPPPPNTSPDAGNMGVGGPVSEVPSRGAGALGGAGSGAAVGSMFGPYGTLIGAGVGALSGYFQSKKQADAAKHAADSQQQGNTAALELQRQALQAQYQAAEADRKANYDQWRAQQERYSQIGQLLGFAPRSIPDYVPMPPPDFSAGSGDGSSHNFGPNGTPMPTSPNAPAPTPTNAGSGQTAEAFIRQYQQSHPASEGMGGLLSALQGAGYDAKPYLYGSTPSNNEISLNGSKYKLLSAEGSPNQSWYIAGTNDSGPGRGPLSYDLLTRSSQPPSLPFVNPYGYGILG